MTTAAAAGDTPTCKSMGRDTAMYLRNLVNSEDISIKETIPSQQNEKIIRACVETRDQAPFLEKVESIVRTIWQHIELVRNILTYNICSNKFDTLTLNKYWGAFLGDKIRKLGYMLEQLVKSFILAIAVKIERIELISREVLNDPSTTTRLALEYQMMI